MGRIVTREELQARMERGDDLVLVDAMGPEHYARSHLPGAINLPLESVDEAPEVLPDKEAEIIVYCMSETCATSDEEVRELQQMGYRNVAHYAAGKQDWIDAGLPVESRGREHRYERRR